MPEGDASCGASGGGGDVGDDGDGVGDDGVGGEDIAWPRVGVEGVEGEVGLEARFGFWIFWLGVEG